MRSQFVISNDAESADFPRSQFVMSNSIKMGVRRLPYAFTELQAKPKDTPRRRIGFNVDDDN